MVSLKNDKLMKTLKFVFKNYFIYYWITFDNGVYNWITLDDGVTF